MNLLLTVYDIPTWKTLGDVSGLPLITDAPLATAKGEALLQSVQALPAVSTLLLQLPAEQSLWLAVVQAEYFLANAIENGSALDDAAAQWQQETNALLTLQAQNKPQLKLFNLHQALAQPGAFRDSLSSVMKISDYLPQPVNNSLALGAAYQYVAQQPDLQALNTRLQALSLPLSDSEAVALNIERIPQRNAAELACIHEERQEIVKPPASRTWGATKPMRVFRRLIKRMGKAHRKMLRDTALLRTSRYFEPEWYLRVNPDVAESKLDPAEHYLLHGAAEGRRPGPSFDGNWYLQQYPDVAAAGANPLVHFIMYGEKEGRRRSPMRLTDRVKKISVSDAVLLPVEEKISVIVPIYNAVDDVKVCIERLVKYTGKDVDVILINDASPDVRIGPLLEGAANYSNFRIFHNDKNLGFTKTVNRGIELAGNNDVILLNSDARVTPRWIQGFKRALATDHKIATVTAMSDRAGAFSAPDIGNENDLPAGISEEEYAIAFRRRAVGFYPTVPTGNGFCMYIRRRCINEIGGLDAEAFPRGYGEENDFCMRARESGWRNVIDDRTYIFHDRSKSFGGEKDGLIKAGRAVVDERYPDYTKAISIFSESPLINSARSSAKLALQDCYDLVKPRILYVISTITGGTPQTNRDLMLSLIDVNEPWLFRCDSNVMTLFKVGRNKDQLIEKHALNEPVDPLTHRSAEYDRVMVSWLAKYDFEIVHIRHLAWHSLALPLLAKKAGAKVIYSFHDFYSLCPTVKLIDEKLVYCKGVCTSSKGSCTPQLWQPDSMPELKGAWIKRWRKVFSEALNYCDSFVTTSLSAKQTIMDNLDLREDIPFEVIEHGRDFKKFRQPDPFNMPTEKVKILVPGNLDAAKGLDVIRGLLNEDKANKLEIHLLGKCDEEIEDKRIIAHGAYNREDFISHVENIKPHIGVVFSIWDETWCHTLTELWASGLPSIVFGYPTVTSRVQQSGAGWVGSSDIEKLYIDLTQNYSQIKEYKKKLANVRSWQQSTGYFNTVRFMSVQYLNLYKDWQGDRLKDVIAVVSRANEAQDRASGSAYVRVWEKTHNSISRRKTYLRLTPRQLLAGLEAGIIKKAIIQRNVLPEDIWQLVKKYVSNKSFSYLLDIDDDLLDVPTDKDPKGLYKNYRSTLLDIVKSADKVLVSTAPLYEKYIEFNKAVILEPNKLSRECWLKSPKKLSTHPFSALYFGSYTHAEDLKLIIPSLREVYKKYPQFRLKLVGVDSSRYDNEPWLERIAIPDDAREYPKFVALLKRVSEDCFVGLAPLKKNNFNNFKSGLKALEYLGLGLPSIASESPAYAGVAKTTSAIKLAKDDEWFGLIEEALISRGSSSFPHSIEYFDELSFDLIFEGGEVEMIKIIRCSIDSTFLRVAFDISQLNIRSDNWSVQAFRGSKLLDDAFHKLFTIDVIKPSERIELNYNYSAAVEPVSSIALSIDGSLHVVLDNLFPEDDADFRKFFIRKVQRTGSVQLDYFVSFQIGKFFIGSPSYICCAQVVKAYKSVEINDPSILNNADACLSESYALLEQCKVDWHPRRNKEHLLVSMLCAHWHVKLALGDREGFEDILNRVKSSIDSISNFYTPSYPITLSLLILTIYLAGLNNAEGSKETAKLLVDIFKKAVRDLDPSEVVLFGELAVSHKATLCALQINENKFVMDDSLRKKIINAFRVKGKAADRLCIKFENVLKREELK